MQAYNIDEEQRKRINFDYNQHEAAIKAWKAHLVRTVLQEEAKQAALDKLDDETCLIIVDSEQLHSCIDIWASISKH